MAIPRGVTPTFILTFDEDGLDLTTARNVYVTFENGAVITKTGDALSVAARQIEVFLTQADTLALARGAVKIQANWTFDDETRAASDIVSYVFGPQLLNRVVE